MASVPARLAGLLLLRPCQTAAAEGGSSFSDGEAWEQPRT